MTVHPIDTEALRDADFLHPALLRTATLHLAPTATQGEAFAAGALYGRERFEDRERLAAAEHRATRAEAQSETRRIDIDYWQGVARGNAIAADVWKESAEEAEARIKAVRDVLELHGPAHDEPGQDEADCGPQIIADIRRALDS